MFRYKTFIFVRMKPYRFKLTWQQIAFAALLALLGFLLSRCKDLDPPPPGIEGQWRQVTSPYWMLDFDNGILTQKAKFSGQPLTVLQFTYAERGDTLYIGGDLHNPPRTWLTRLLSDNDLKATEIPADTSIRAWTVLYFERI